MIFVPSVGGISHSPREFSHPEDIANGANVLLHTLLKLDSGIEPSGSAFKLLVYSQAELESELNLLVSQSNDRIDFCRTPRRNVTGDRGDENKQQRDQRERCWISRRDAKQQRRHHSR